MNTILLVKLSSLGDVIHNFPVATDLRARFPEATIHWVVEEQYGPLVALHPAVNRVIPIALRRWRKSPLRTSTWRDFAAFRRELTATRYDAIIDTQGLLKSALVARMARGPRHGFAKGSAREPLASCFYDRDHDCPPGEHMLFRCRSLAAQAAGYAIDTDRFDYGIRASAPPPAIVNGPYCVLFHSTARASKLWPEERWIALGNELARHGLRCVLPAGNAGERARSERLAAAIPDAVVPAPLSIPEIAALIAGARVVIGVDTGLMHLAVALSIPVAGLYCDSNPAEVGPIGPGPNVYRGGVGQPPTIGDAIAAVREVAPGLL